MPIKMACYFRTLRNELRHVVRSSSQRLGHWHKDEGMFDLNFELICQQVDFRMAEWWNKKYEFKLWSSLWLFLREVEGLDDTRARKYLEQLLENGYDSVDVLKLATKQDLVDDANILPGDALRIIAAAVALAARRDADRAEVFHQERKHGGEVRSEFSLMQETKAAQENVAQGNGLLPLPRHTILQQGSERHVRTRTGRIYYACGLCMITCSSEHWLRLHFNGKKHADRMEQGEDDGRRTAVRYAGTSASGQLVISPKAYHCSLCNITCTGKNDLINHFKGRRHQALMEEDSDDEDPQAAFQYVPPRPAARFRPVGLSQPAGPCSQRFQMESATRGLANLSMS